MAGATTNALLVVKLGRVMAGATPFRLGNINDTYRGSVFSDGRVQTAILKDLEPKELANEVMSAAIGILLGLPIPPAVLAFASADRLPASKGPIVDTGRLVYASVDVNQPQVAMLYLREGRRVLERLAQWPDLGRLYGFDTLVANIDRHAGNLLFSGDKEVWLIDHGWCFTGPHWKSADLTPADVRSKCRLNEWLTPSLDHKRRAQTASAAVAIEAAADQLDIRTVANTNHMTDLLDGAEFEAVIEFLKLRPRHVPKLAAEALGIAKIL